MLLPNDSIVKRPLSGASHAADSDNMARVRQGDDAGNDIQTDDKISSTKPLLSFIPRANEYTSKQIAAALGGVDSHSFMLKCDSNQAAVAASKNLRGRGRWAQSHLLGNSRAVASDKNAELVAILIHRDASPTIASEPEEFEIWTRHDFNIILKHQVQGTSLPLFHYSLSDNSERLWSRSHSSLYLYLGQYILTDATIVKAHSIELRIFVEKRPESKRMRSAETWKAMFGNDWLKVRARRVEEAEDPVARNQEKRSAREASL